MPFDSITGTRALSAVIVVVKRAITSGRSGKYVMRRKPSASHWVKKLPFEPGRIKGLSEKLLVSHYENNYTGAVKRLNAISAQLAALDWGRAPVFQVNGLKREELIATNSMILHELYFDGLGGEGAPGAALAEAMARDFGSVERW